MAELCECINAKKSFTTPYHPQADGKVERFNRTIQRLLACCVDRGQRNWDIILPYVLYAYNTTNMADRHSTYSMDGTLRVRSY